MQWRASIPDSRALPEEAQGHGNPLRYDAPMPHDQRPRIAINGLLLTEKKERLALDMRYSQAVWLAGGFPVPIPPLEDAAYREALLDQVDGLVLTGGDDFDTERLGLGPTHPKADVTPQRKQDFDLALTRAALERGLPTLGICYGMQCMGLVGGANLLQHLPDDRPGTQNHSGGVEHEVWLEPGSKLASEVGVESVPVISRHHQALDAVAGPWAVCARDHEGLVEAIEHREHPFAIGVQWHPEASASEGPHGKIFQGLVRAAKRYAAQASPVSAS